MQTISITEARKRLPELVKKAFLGSKSFIITKGGIPMAKITKADKTAKKRKFSAKERKKAVEKAIKMASKIDGIWNDKKWKDKSSVEIVNYLRKKAWRSHAS